MKILMIHCAYQIKGGENKVVQEEIQLLESIGNTVQLLQFSNSSNALLKLLQLPFNMSAYSKTTKAIRSFSPDIVHIHNLHFAGSASVIYAIKRMRIPQILTLHNFRLLCPSGILFFDGRLFLDSLKQKFYWKAIWKGVYKDSRLLTLWLSVSMQFHQFLNTWKIPRKYIVFSQHARDLFYFSKLGLKDKQLVIKPNFTSALAINTSMRKDHFLFVGRLSEEKGIEFLLNTFAATPQYSVQIVGDGPYKDKVIEYVNKFPNIVYLGVLDAAEIGPTLQKCSALIFPSIWYEGMPLTIIESFATGTPVIASRLGAMETMIQHRYNGLHFEPQDTNDLQRQLKEWTALTQEEKSVIGTNALHTYNQLYTAPKNAEQLIEIYKEAINEN